MTSPQQLAELGLGGDANDAEPALPLYFPSPGIMDRSLLPAVKQNVVVDVSISAAGDVTDEKLVRGLGNSLDQIVLATVKSWRFHPATLNGTAVASVERLVFPLDKDWQPNQQG
jgi:TonB family protein